MSERGGGRRWVVGMIVATLVRAAVAAAQAEPVGRVLTLPEKPAAHWFWLSDIILHRTALFDADTGHLLGSISSGTAGVGFVISPLFSPDHREIYLAESYYARGVRGERTDVVTIYDGTTLAPVHEIPIPPKRAEYFPGVAANALSDDGRFVAVFNATPAQSLSIVDVRARRFAAEVPTPGCGLVYAAGPRRFLMLCADGAALVVGLDAEGRPAEVARTAAFFDPQKDPVTEKAVRRDNQWLFVSFEGMIHPVDVAADPLSFGEPWSLFTEAERRAAWRVGGIQQLALHARSGRLYALVHQGPPDTHKEPGTEIWVYDLGERSRVQRLSVLNPLASFINQQLGLAPASYRARPARWLLRRTLPNPGVDRILVTQDAEPVLVAAAMMPPTVTIHDAITGDVRREIEEIGIAGSLLSPP